MVLLLSQYALPFYNGVDPLRSATWLLDELSFESLGNWSVLSLHFSIFIPWSF